ncbi:MAG: hypothetical protein OEP95_10775 [Myxococcales bacterium]|nr:hypothetical protein [Myxococcales bacterium]
MILSTRIRRTALACCLLFLAPIAAQAQYPAKKVEGFLKRDVKAIARDHKASMQECVDHFEVALGELDPMLLPGMFLESDVASATLDVVADALHEIELINRQAMEAVAIAAQFEEALSIDGKPDGFLVGTCGELDHATELIERNVTKAIRKMKKALQDVAKGAADAVDGGNVIAGLNPPPVPPIAPNPGAPAAPAAPKKLEIDSRASASNGNMCVGGTADGGFVMITIRGGGRTITKSVPVDADSCRFKVCFGSFHGDGALPRGNYDITAEHLPGDEVTETTTGSHGMP